MTSVGLRRLTVAALVAALLPTSGARAQVPPTPSRVSETVPFRSVATAYAEDFESGPGGFVAGGSPAWEYGVPVSPPTALAGQGPSMWGTTLDGDYEPNQCGWIDSPVIDLGGVEVPATSDPVRVSAARLAFRSWMHTEFRWDAGIVLASRDGQSWSPLQSFSGYPATAFSRVRECFGIDPDQGVFTTPTNPEPSPQAWKLAELDLTPYLGGEVQLRWVFASSSITHRRGWYVDDIIVQTGVGAGAAVPLPDPQDADTGFTPLTAVYAESFETDAGGWEESGTGAWQWGEAVAPPDPPVGSLAMWGTRLDGDYHANECSSVTSPPFLLPAANPRHGVESARAQLKLWRHTRTGYDGGILQVSADGGGWETLVPLDGYDRTLVAAATQTAECLGISSDQRVWSGPFSQPAADAWLDVEASLTPYMGREVRLRIVFGSTDETDRRGMYVDDVLVQVGAGADETVAQPCEGLAGWQVTGRAPSWCYGHSSSGPSSSTPVWSTNPYGDYNPNECSAIESPAIPTDLVTGLGALELRFEHFVKTRSADDGGVVQVSVDEGTTWQTVTPSGGYNSTLLSSARSCIDPDGSTVRGWSGNATSGSYAPASVRLSAFDGETIRVRFLFGSGASSHDLGWHVRGIQITKGLLPLPLG